MADLSLLKRLVKGSPLTATEHDTNLSDIENAVNELKATTSLTLNTDGTLKAGAVDAATKVVDKVLTLAKIEDLAAKGVLRTTADGRLEVLVGTDGQVLQFGETGLLAVDKTEADQSGRLVFENSVVGSALLIPSQTVTQRILVTCSSLVYGNAAGSSFLAKVPINIDVGSGSFKIKDLVWWSNGTTSVGSQQQVTFSYTVNPNNSASISIGNVYEGSTPQVSIPALTHTEQYITAMAWRA